MLKTLYISVALCLFSFTINAQALLQEGLWQANLIREDGNPIVFNIDIQQLNGKTVLYIVNGQEKMLVNDVKFIKDSLFVEMPVFESSFQLKVISKDSISGSWLKRGAVNDLKMPFSASAKRHYRFSALHGDATQQVDGKWKIRLGNNKTPAIGIFTQQGNEVRGSILTASGDYRYLSGSVSGDLLRLSTFDGIHAILFTARVDKDSLVEAKWYSSKSAVQQLTGVKDVNASLPEEKLTSLKDPENAILDFSFKDLDGKQVSIKDKRFKGKVVVIQLMGSWCPNCMDETEFMTAYYEKNKQRGVEMIGLAYEYTTDENRSRASLRKFQKRFNVTYPLLITPVSVSDPQRTEKTLPQLSGIKVFPTTLILDRRGKVVEISTDFAGPGTGAYHVKFIEEFNEKMDKLLIN